MHHSGDRKHRGATAHLSISSVILLDPDRPLDPLSETLSFLGVQVLHRFSVVLAEQKGLWSNPNAITEEKE